VFCRSAVVIEHNVTRLTATGAHEAKGVKGDVLDQRLGRTPVYEFLVEGTDFLVVLIGTQDCHDQGPLLACEPFIG